MTPTRLAPREMEVLDLMAQGCSNTGIAGRMYLSGKTVEWIATGSSRRSASLQGPGTTGGSAPSSLYLAMESGDRDPEE